MGLLKRLGITKLLGSKRTRQLSALSMAVQAGGKLRRGDSKMAALYLLGAALAYKNSSAGFAAQAVLRTLGRR